MKSSINRKTSAAFTLVEMLAVVAVISLILAAVVPMVFGTLLATKITTAGDAMLGQISYARQLAVSRNRVIEMRIYSYIDPELPGTEATMKAVVLVETPDPLGPVAVGTAPSVAVSETYYLPSGVAIARNNNLSPIIGPGRAPVQDRERFIRKAQNATYKSIQFNPDGSTNVSLPTSQCYLTIGDERLIGGEASGKVPDNFFAIQIDPLTGRARAYRPGA